MSLTEIFQIVFAPTAIVAGVTYLLRKYLDMHFVKELEQFKNKLQSESEKSKIEFKTHLEAKLFEYQTKFSLYHSKQADTVAELYGFLADTATEIEQLTFFMQPPTGVSVKEKKDKANELFRQLSIFHRRHRIYFSNDLNQKIRSVTDLMGKSLSQFDVAHTWGMQGGNNYGSDWTGAWQQAWDTISNGLPPLMNELEIYFHDILEGKYDRFQKRD
jgi:hypothetical protein